MRFIVVPQLPTTRERLCALEHTMCMLCSEDPRACA